MATHSVVNGSDASERKRVMPSEFQRYRTAWVDEERTAACGGSSGSDCDEGTTVGQMLAVSPDGSWSKMACHVNLAARWTALRCMLGNYADG